MKILMVLTSHDKLGDTGLKTGFWLEEFASPYFVFKDQSFEVTLASPQGVSPRSIPKVMSLIPRQRLQFVFEKTTKLKRRWPTPSV